MNEVRQYYFGDKVHEIGRKAQKLGAGGTSHGHTCPDFSIGLTQGWGGILERIDKSLAKYERLEHAGKVTYLKGLKLVCESIIRYIQKHADKALELAANETNREQKALYTMIAKDCAHIAYNPPASYHQAVQWLQFAVMTDRMVGHGNGYGRLDHYLIPFYKQDIAKGKLSREQAREYLAEMFLKLRGQVFALCGRQQDGSDATNEMSWVVMESFDMIDDYNNLGLMWHPDIDSDFYDYACDVLARHGSGVPSLVNYDLLHDTELRSGVDEDVAWTVSYSGCQWFCIPGREYCDQDTNALNLLDPMFRALDRTIEEEIDDYEQFYSCFMDEFKKTCEAFREFKDCQYDALPNVWPEMPTSLNCHGPIERGLDITAPRGVDVQFTSTNILGIVNVADSFYAIKKLVFDQRIYTLEEVRNAVKENWDKNEAMRQRFLNQDKYGNDIDEVDGFFVRLTESIADVMDNMRNNRGQHYRASLYQFQGHTAVDILPATPDGRFAYEPLALGVNPTSGRNTKGLLATANSTVKPHLHKFQGGCLQVEMQPKFFDGKENIGQYIRDFSEAYFKKNAFQINLNIVDLEALKDAIDHPDKPEYRNIVIKVTGYTSRFICLAKSFQKEFVGRNNYEAM